MRSLEKSISSSGSGARGIRGSPGTSLPLFSTNAGRRRRRQPLPGEAQAAKGSSPVDLCSHAGRRGNARQAAPPPRPPRSRARRESETVRTSGAAPPPFSAGRAGYSADVGPRSGTLRRRCYSSVSSVSGSGRICAYALSGDEKLKCDSPGLERPGLPATNSMATGYPRLPTTHRQRVPSSPT